MPTPSDLFLSPNLTEERALAYLRTLGFRDPAAADRHLQSMADDPIVRESLGRLAPDLLPALLESPDPDAAAAGLAGYLAARTGRSLFLGYLREDPLALHVITYVLGSSPFLSEILIRNPECFHWLISQFERSAPDRRDLEEDVAALLVSIEDPAEALNALRRWHRRETLRVAARDLLRRETVQTATAQISDLAGVVVDVALAIATRQSLEADERDALPGTFAVVGMGTLGGRELGYSPEIDLLYVYDGAEDKDAHAFFQRLGRTLTAMLGEETEEGGLYRVNTRLPAAASGGSVACALDEYGAGQARLEERLTFATARPIAGDPELGRRFLARAQSLAFSGDVDRAGLEEVSRSASSQSPAQSVGMLAQLLQLMHGVQHPSLRHPGTLAALDALVRAGLVADQLGRELTHAYVLLRSVEHRLQLVQDDPARPTDGHTSSQEIGARHLGLGPPEDLEKQLSLSHARVHEISRDLLGHP